MLYSIKQEGGGYKIGACTNWAGLNLEIVKMKVEQGKKVKNKRENSYFILTIL